MKYSKLLGKSRYDAPCDADSVNAKFLTQAGYIEKLSAGVYNYLPLGKRVLDKISNIVREEMDAIDSQEILMPALHPIDIWKQSGRDRVMDDVLYRVETSSKEFVLGPSHEETVTPLLAQYVQSYKDLPISVYQIQSKFRDEPRAKSGVLRGREFVMKDMYSFHKNEESLDAYYQRAIEAYFNVFKRCNLDAYLIEASGGAFSDKFSHEFSVKSDVGEDVILIDPKTNKAQNLEIAGGKVAHFNNEAELELVEVEVDRGSSVTANAKAHDVNEARILKTLIFRDEESNLYGVLIRGDLNINELKLTKYLQKRVEVLPLEEVEKLGLVRGFISPCRFNEDIEIKWIADNSIKHEKNFITGANKKGVDLVNVNVGRDFVVEDFADLVEVRGGFISEETGEQLEEINAVEAGNIFKLGTKFSKAFNLKYTDSDGKQKDVVMGCYGIGISRLMGTVVEAFHDENGIIWPKEVAPYSIHLLNLGNDESVKELSEKLYQDLKSQGFEVLFDERDERAGVKLKDADLLGMPIRILVSKKTIEKDSVEFKLRNSKDAELIKISDLVTEIHNFLNN